MTQTPTTLIATYGLIAVVVLMAAESCGIPLPSEVIMPAAGVLAAAGHLDLVLAVVFGAVGNLCGSLLAYWLAARLGRPTLLGPGRRLGISGGRLELSERRFLRYGAAAIFLGRLLPVVRTYMSFPAGLARVRLTAFAGLTLAGALPWCAALALAGYFLGEGYGRISGPIEKVAIVCAALLAVLLVAWFLRGRRRGSLAPHQIG